MAITIAQQPSTTRTMATGPSMAIIDGAAHEMPNTKGGWVLATPQSYSLPMAQKPSQPTTVSCGDHQDTTLHYNHHQTSSQSPIFAASGAAAAELSPPTSQSGPRVHLALDVCWTAAETGARFTKRLPLNAIASVSDLKGLFRSLICGAFPLGPPDYLTSGEYYKFAPAEEYASFPGDAIESQFRLMATYQGWEVAVAERALGGIPDPERRLLVTVAEFESEPMELSDGTEVVVTMVTYPTVSVQRDLLDVALRRLVAAASGAAAAYAALEDDASSAAEI